jgi:hypothetical protein
MPLRQSRLARLERRLGLPRLLLLGLGLASLAAVAGAQDERSGSTLVCIPLADGAEDSGDLYRCVPATVVGQDIVATATPATLTLGRDEYEGLLQEIASLRTALARSSGSALVPPLPAAGAAGPPADLSEGSPQPTNDLLWRTPQGEPPPPPTVAPPPERRFSLLDANVGAGDGGNATFGFKGRYFSRFGDHRAVQAEGSFLYYDERREIELDLGLVHRIRDFQLGLFGSAKHLGFRDFEDAATLAQAAVTADWIFHRGRLGLFGSAGVHDRDVVDRRLLRRNVQLVTFVEVVDQMGISGSFHVFDDVYVEGNAAYLIAADSRRETGGLLRFVYPVSPRWAFTAEGSWNDTLISSSNDQARFALGMRTGTWLGPQELASLTTAAPVEIPQVRYEVRTRERRLGNDFPVADAGPDQLLTADCSTSLCSVTVTLDGSGSFDPDSDPLSYSWTPRAGFEGGEVIESADRAVARFAAREGGRYVIRLTVSDGEHSGSDEVAVTVASRPEVKIVRFKANPKRIGPGEVAMLEWKGSGRACRDTYPDDRLQPRGQQRRQPRPPLGHGNRQALTAARFYQAKRWLIAPGPPGRSVGHKVCT